MNNVTIIVPEKKQRRKFSSWGEALESLRWWVVLGHAERVLVKFVVG